MVDRCVICMPVLSASSLKAQKQLDCSTDVRLLKRERERERVEKKDELRKKMNILKVPISRVK